MLSCIVPTNPALAKTGHWTFHRHNRFPSLKGRIYYGTGPREARALIYACAVCARTYFCLIRITFSLLGGACRPPPPRSPAHTHTHLHPRRRHIIIFSSFGARHADGIKHNMRFTTRVPALYIILYVCIQLLSHYIFAAVATPILPLRDFVYIVCTLISISLSVRCSNIRKRSILFVQYIIRK